LGWSESYYADMKAEAEREVRRLCLPLREALADLQAAIGVYGDFTARRDELEALMRRLELFLAEYE